MTLLDISVPIHSDMFVYPGNPQVHIERVQALARGDSANLSRIDLGVHTGTHVDAPAHFIDGAPGVDRIPPETLIGPAYIVDASGLSEGQLDAAYIASVGLPQDATRVLFKTRNSGYWTRDAFATEYAALTPDGAAALTQRGVALVGIDYLSIGKRPTGGDTHRELLTHGVVIVEGLDLSQVASGWYELLCLPLRLVDADGAPARAVLRTLP